MNPIFVAGMGRSGTTWVSDLINFDLAYRILFEPFFPLKVPQAGGFEYIQYMHPTEQNERLASNARQLLRGEIENSWTDQNVSGLGMDKPIIVKDIRCNLMLAWLQSLQPDIKIVLVVRHPLQVVSSWRALSWGKEFGGKRSDLEIILSQAALIKDFPEIESAVESFDLSDFIQRTVILWSINYLVPLTHLAPRQRHVIFYENLVTRPEQTTRALFEYLSRPFDWNLIQSTVTEFSRTNFRAREWSDGLNTLIRGWRNEITNHEIERASEIMRFFGLHHLYDEDGFPRARISSL